MKNEDIIQQAMDRFERVESSEAVMRQRAVEDLEFCGGDQWSDQQKISRLGRPMLTINKIAGSLKKVKGDQRKMTPSIKVRPVDGGADPEIAKIYNGLIKNIEKTSVAESTYNAVFDQAIEGGFGYFRIDTDYCDDKSFDQEIKIVKVLDQFSVYMDTDCTSDTCEDANWCIIAETMSKESFEAEYPDVECSDFPLGSMEYSDWENNDSVRVAEYYWKEPIKYKLYLLEDGSTMTAKDIKEEGSELKDIDGIEHVVKFIGSSEEGSELIPSDMLVVENTRDVVSSKLMWVKMTCNEVLEGPVEKVGKYIPVVLMPGEVSFVKGKRVLSSAHHQARDAQKDYNLMASTSIESIAMAPKQPFLLTAKQIQGYERSWNQASTTPLPYLLYNQEVGVAPPTRQVGSITDQGAANERLMAADDIKATTGIHDAALGAPGSEVSGNAIQARALQSSIASFIFTDNLTLAITQAGRIIVDLIPHIYDSNRVVRILGSDGNEEFAEVNKVAVNEDTGEEEILNDLSVGKYDVVVDVGVDFATRRLETVDVLSGIMRAVPQYAPQMIDILIKNMDFPDSDVLYDRFQQMSNPQPLPVDPMVELKLQEQQLDNAKTIQELEHDKVKQSIDINKSKQELRAGTLDNMVSMQELVKLMDERDYANEERIKASAGKAALDAITTFQDSSMQRYDPYTDPPKYADNDISAFGSINVNKTLANSNEKG